MRIGRTLPPAASPIYIRDIINGFKGLVRGQQEIERFRSELKDFYGVKHVFLVSSGKAALTLILSALHDLHPDRDEVLIPAFICYSVPSAIVRAGLKIKLCDINLDTLDFNYDQLKELVAQSVGKVGERKKVGSWEGGKVGNDQQLTTNNLSNEIHANGKRSEFHRDKHADPKLLAVIPAHLFGLPANVEHVQSLVDDPLVSIVEDAAQVLGSNWNGKKLGTLGGVSFFSLGRGKALSTVEGGIILTNRDDVAENIEARLSRIPKYSISELIKLVTNAIILIFFQHPSFFWLPKSLPFLRVGDTIYDPEFKLRKLSAFQAGLTKNWRKKLHTFQEHRQSGSKYWRSVLKASSIHSYCTKNGHVPDLLRFPVRVADGELWKNLLKRSEKNGDGVMFTYPTSINGIDELQEVFQGQTFPAAEKLPHQLLTIPVHPYVSPEDKKKILNLIAQPNEGSPPR
jgi:perosamine synthetase